MDCDTMESTHKVFVHMLLLRRNLGIVRVWSEQWVSVYGAVTR